MNNIIFAVTNDSMAAIVRRTWDLHESYYACHPDVHYGSFICKILIGDNWEHVVERCTREDRGYDAIVTRGSLATLLKRHFINIPTVEIPITAQDFKRCIDLAVSAYGRKKVGIVGTPSMLAMLSFYQRHSDLDVEGILVNPFGENYRATFGDAIEQALRQNCKIIVGGTISEIKCFERGVDFQRLETSEESVWQAITEAKRTAHMFRQERHNAMMYQTIVDYAQEGIIATDIAGSIRLFNNMSANILGITKHYAVGRPIEKIFPAWEEQSADDQQDLNVIVKHNNTRINMNKVRLVMGGEHIGSVITFQNVTSITEMERLVRSKLHKRGHTVKYTFDDIIGNSPLIRDAVRNARTYAGVDSNLIIYGESGTGKEIFAQAIHNHSNRNGWPFVALNCAAIPESLLESELFGYADGAFTGALKGGRQGLFEQAHRGTIFLDEICDIPLNLQGRLLRVIQEQEVMRIGDDRIIPINVRVVCASHKRLRELADQGGFREDLYYRLNVLRINLPPLRERGEDILLLARHYLDRHAALLGKPAPALDPDLRNQMMEYAWKGNIRELKNFCERLVVAGEDGALRPRRPAPLCGGGSHGPAPGIVAGQERERLREALAAAKYNRIGAAKMLGISRTTLWKKMREYGDI